MSTVDKAGNRRHYINLSQLYGVIRRKEQKKFLQFIIEKQHDINYQIPETDFLLLHRSELIGCTALHLALCQDNFESFDLLLKNHADYNMKNYKQMTVLHRAVEENFIKQEIAKIKHRFRDHDKDFTVGELNTFITVKDINERGHFHSHNWRLWGKFKDKYVDAILLASLGTKEVLKSSDDDGISLLHAACLTNNIEAVEFLLKNGADVNAPSCSSIFDGFTPLHFAVKYSSVEVVKILLANKASFLTRNSKFMSPMDFLVDQNMKIMEWLHAKNKLPYQNCILDYVENEDKLISIMSKHFEGNEFHYSSFHANLCCMLNSFPSDSIVFPGYTALHFAALFNIDTAKLLIEDGADVDAENKYGVTPLHIFETRATIDDLYHIVSQKESWKHVAFEDHKTKLLELIASMNELRTFNGFLREIDDINLRIPDDAPLWSGYTTLHLVVTFSETVRKTKFFNNIFNCDRSNLKVEYENCCEEQRKTQRDRIVLYLIKNADVTIQDRQGRTPINLAFRQRNMETVELLFKNHDKAVNPTDDDNLSHLHIACLAKNLDLVEKLLVNGADVNARIKSSFKWHCNYHRCTSTDVFDLIGSTPLHLSVSTCNLELVKLLLKYGADVNAKDALGLTPLHRIFVMQQLWKIDKDFFSDNRTLDCALNRSLLTRELPKLFKDERISNELLASPSLKESIVDDFGLSHLHIAVHHANDDVARKLLDEGSNVNLAITYPKDLESNHPLLVLRQFDGYVPLHMIRDRESRKLEESLLKYGADILARRGDSTNELFVKLQDSHKESSALYIGTLKENECLRARLKEEFGWTTLHVACHLLDYQLTRFALSIGVDVNSRTKEDSPMHPGCTALCILIVNSYKSEQNCDCILTLLLDSGADVMLADARGNTPLHTNFMYMDRLLRYVRYFDVNPTNHEGISVFHLACLRNNFDVISNFLDHGVDVNRSVEFFIDNDLAGCSPLHLLVRCHPRVREENIFSSAVKRTEEIERILLSVELLIKCGADVNAENALGNTPLHMITERDPPRDVLFEWMLSHGANFNVKNVHSKTTFELLLTDTRITSQELEFCLKLGCRMNAFNEITQVGFIPLFLESINGSREASTLKKLAWRCPSIGEVDCKGRTVIHNIVSSTNFSDILDHSVIGYFIKIVGDIDRQDISGTTALHLATRFLNFGGIEALLSHGYDVNVIDSTGRTAFAYALGTEFLCDSINNDMKNHRRVILIFMRIFYHMTYRGLRVNNVNADALTRAYRKYELDWMLIGSEYEQIKVVKIADTAFTLGDFLSETKAIVYYSKIPREDRDSVQRFFVDSTVDTCTFQSWMFLCKLQLGKAMQRAELVGNAKNAMNVLLGFPLPDLCYEAIEKFLSNEDLKSTVVAASL